MARWQMRKQEKSEIKPENIVADGGLVTPPEQPSSLMATDSDASVLPRTSEDREAVVAEFVRSQETRFKRSLERRKQAFVSKLEGKREIQTEVAVRQLQIQRLRQEIQSRRDEIQKLKLETKELRAQKQKPVTASPEVAA